MLLKLLVTRARPYHFFDFPEGFHRAYGGVLTTFSMWGTEMGSRVQSMPSGHTATAVGLAIGLCWAYPRAWGWFLALAVLATLQRIECGAHFVSDTLAAAALACAVGAICFSPRLLGGRFTELESSNSGATTRP